MDPVEALREAAQAILEAKTTLFEYKEYLFSRETRARRAIQEVLIYNYERPREEMITVHQLEQFIHINDQMVEEEKESEEDEIAKKTNLPLSLQNYIEGNFSIRFIMPNNNNDNSSSGRN
jgi:hypothetical protein